MHAHLAVDHCAADRWEGRAEYRGERRARLPDFPQLRQPRPAQRRVDLLEQPRRGANRWLRAQLAHDAAGRAWLDTQRFGWTRFVCRAGENRFECFDYESLRFLQVHVHDAEGPVVVRDVGLRRRSYAWPSPPGFRVSEPSLQRVLEASFNTLVNSAQETIVDGMGRERQQYSGDVSHQLHATRLVCGDRQLSRRFLRSFAMGQTLEGFFLDCWPAFDRLSRLAQRQLGATRWGPLLDHGVSFVSDAWQHHQETGDSDLPLLLYPGFVRFAIPSSSSFAATSAPAVFTLTFLSTKRMRPSLPM